MSNREGYKPTTSPRSARFQPSVDQIPTPGSKHDKPPRYEPLVLNIWAIQAISVLMIVIGILLQIALFLSQTRNGFPVPQKNILRFAPTQFLTTFFPTLIAVPLAQFWTQADWLLRWYQPYVTLSRGRTPATRSILLDYVALGQLGVLYNSWIYKHYLIYISTLIALSVILLQPLAGSLLQVREVPHTTDATALLMGSIGLSPTIDNLDGFLASAGFAIASVYDSQIDPPFVNGVWAAGQFQAQPGSYLNGSLAVNTTAIRTAVNCASPSSLNVTTNTEGSYVASATFSDGCSASNVFSASNGTEQFSVVSASSCGSSGLDLKFQPVVFWFYLNSSSPQVASVYCNPTMDVFTVQTSMNLTTSSLGPCTIIDTDDSTNNVTGSPQYGRPYNGVIFNPTQDPYTTSRAVAINFGIPDAIYRYASRQPGGPLSVFQDTYGFLNVTKTIYTQYLASASHISYFLADNSTIPAQLTTQIPRLFVEPLPALILSPLIILIGFVGFGIHFLHRRARRRLWLTSPPGSIGAIVSLTSRSGFGQLLLPYDNEERMQERLAGLTFRLDERTGAIVAEEDIGTADSSDGEALLGRENPYEPIPLKSMPDRTGV